MICCNTYVRCPLFYQLQHPVQYANCGPKGFVLAFIKTTLAIKVAEQFVSAIDQVNNHTANYKTPQKSPRL